MPDQSQTPDHDLSNMRFETRLEAAQRERRERQELRAAEEDKAEAEGKLFTVMAALGIETTTIIIYKGRPADIQPIYNAFHAHQVGKMGVGIMMDPCRHIGARNEIASKLVAQFGLAPKEIIVRFVD